MIVVFQSLRRRVIVDTREVLVINKPYGMSMHSGGNISSSSKFALTSYLQELATFFQAEKLYTVHRLDKEVTGMILTLFIRCLFCFICTKDKLYYHNHKNSWKITLY